MSEPIISPWIIYFISQSFYIRATFFILFAVFFAFVLYLLLDRGEMVNDWTLYNRTPELYSEALREVNDKLEVNKKKIIKYISISLALLFIAFSIPNEETFYKMLVADQLTYENVDKLGDSAKDTVDYIFDKIEEVQNGSTESEEK